MQYFTNELVKENINFDFILEKIRVSTPYGKEYKKKLKPFIIGEENLLREELDRIDKLIKLVNENGFIFRNLQSIFAHIKDLRNSISRCKSGNTLTVVELFEIKNFLFLLRDIERTLDSLDWDIPKDLKVKNIPYLIETFDPAKENLRTFYIYDNYSERLAEIRQDKKIVENQIKKEKKNIRKDIEKELGIKLKSNGEILIAKSESELIKRIDNNQYLVYNSETYMNIKYSIKSLPSIDNLKEKLQQLKEDEEKEEFNIREEISYKISEYSEEILRNMDAIGKLDLSIAKAYMAIKTGGIKPQVKDEQILKIVEGRHLKVEETVKSKKQKFIPISVEVANGVTCITGANMGGKTISLKMIGLLSTMVQYGLFVPCKSMEMGLHNFVHISTGDSQSTDMGLSTFGAEIKELQEVINNKKQRGLILIDELARGTNPEEGYAISKGIVNYFKNKSNMTIITTHYDNVANTDGVVHLQVIGLANINYEILKDELKEKEYGIEVVSKYMDYRLKRVESREQVPRDAINIARLMGLDETIIKDAERELEEQNI